MRQWGNINWGPELALGHKSLVDAQKKIYSGSEGATLTHECSTEILLRMASKACSSQIGHVSTLQSCGSAREILNRVDIANWTCSGSSSVVHVPGISSYCKQLFSPGPIWKLDTAQALLWASCNYGLQHQSVEIHVLTPYCLARSGQAAPGKSVVCQLTCWPPPRPLPPAPVTAPWSPPCSSHSPCLGRSLCS